MRDIFFPSIKINNLTMGEAVKEIRLMIQQNRKGFIVTPNAAHIVLLRKDEEFRKAYQKANLVLADGMSLVIASKILGYPLKGRCAGADLFEKVCDISAELGKNIFLLGGTNGSEKIAAKKIKQKYSNINVITHCPEFSFEKNAMRNREIINKINESGAGVLFICIGTPKSEKWIYNNLFQLGITLACPFGSSLEYFAGTKKRAPKWMQKYGLEWFYRFVQEPKRLCKRYLIGNTIFIWLILKELFKKGSVE